MEQTEITKKITLRELYKKGIFKSVSFLSFNKSGYPYVTLLNKDRHPNVVYFGKKTAELVKNQFKSGDDLIANGFLSTADVIETQNSNEETRFKLSISTGDYTSSAALEAAFGSTQESDFDLEGFKQQFAKVTNATKAEQLVQA